MSYELRCPKCGSYATNDEEAIFLFKIESIYGNQYDITCTECGKEFERNIPEEFFGDAISQDDDGEWNY